VSARRLRKRQRVQISDEDDDGEVVRSTKPHLSPHLHLPQYPHPEGRSVAKQCRYHSTRVYLSLLSLPPLHARSGSTDRARAFPATCDRSGSTWRRYLAWVPPFIRSKPTATGLPSPRRRCDSEVIILVCSPASYALILHMFLFVTNSMFACIKFAWQQFRPARRASKSSWREYRVDDLRAMATDGIQTDNVALMGVAAVENEHDRMHFHSAFRRQQQRVHSCVQRDGGWVDAT